MSSSTLGGIDVLFLLFWIQNLFVDNSIFFFKGG